MFLLSGCTEDDPPEFQDWHLEELTPEQGFGFRSPEFDVPAGSEIQDCYFIRVPDLAGGEDFWVDRIVTAINPGSHHMNVFRVKTIVALDGEHGDVVRGLNGQGECFRSSNWADWPLVANSQNSNPTNPYTDWKLPEGVAHRFSPGEKLMVQVHYVNAATQETPYRGRVGINFHRSSVAAPTELGTLFATQQSIRICRSNPEVSYSGTCAFPSGAAVTITAANGHFHSRGQRFSIYAWDGLSDTVPPASARFYESRAWDDPPMATGLETLAAAQPPPGGGIWWTCDYRWQEPEIGCDTVNERDPQKANDCCYTFGPVVETSEHCNVFLYYYPKVNDIFCN